LGSCVLNNQFMDRVVDYLEPDHFANQLHSDMYDHMVGQFRKNKSFTPMSMKPLFEGREELPEDKTSGLYLAQLAASSVTMKHTEAYGRVIHDYWLRRQTIQISQDTQSKAFDKSESTGADIIEEIQGTLSGLSGFSHNGQELVHISDGMNKAMELVTLAMNDENPITGVPTAIDSLDRATGGMKSGQLIILAGRPAMGKTALAISAAKGAALAGKNVAVFSIEMEADELTLRMASDFMADGSSSFSYFDAGNGKLEHEQFNSLSRGAKYVSDLPVHISDRGGNTVDSVRMETRRLDRSLATRGAKIDLIVIDYLQLMTMGRSYRGNRVQEISDITGSLKRLAKEMKIPIVLLSQLNRGLESRENKRPLLSDLRDSGAIEQDADTVLFVYREHYYLKHNEPKSISDQADWRDELKKCEHLLEIIIGKQRRGPTKTLRVEFRLETNTIRDFTSC